MAALPALEGQVRHLGGRDRRETAPVPQWPSASRLLDSPPLPPEHDQPLRLRRQRRRRRRRHSISPYDRAPPTGRSASAATRRAAADRLAARASRSSAVRSAGSTTARPTPSWVAGGWPTTPRSATGRVTTWTATPPARRAPTAVVTASGSANPGVTIPGCGCGPNGCDSFLTGCLQFRYGQCNQDVACLGRIVCRVVACVPPWQVDPSCTTAVAVDNATAEQNEPCWTPAPPVPAV